MAGNLPHYKLGPASYAASGPILGGSLVTVASDGKTVIQNATAGNAVLLGVAVTDVNAGVPEGSAVSSGAWAGNVTNGSDTNLDVSVLGYTVAVANNVDIKVRYSSAANFGDLLYADGSGGVTKTASGSAVGRCTQSGGVASGTAGRAFIRV